MLVKWKELRKTYFGETPKDCAVPSRASMPGHVSPKETTRMRKAIKMAMPIAGPLAAIVVFNATGSIWGMIMAAWVALILFFVL